MKKYHVGVLVLSLLVTTSACTIEDEAGGDGGPCSGVVIGECHATDDGDGGTVIDGGSNHQQSSSRNEDKIIGFWADIESIDDGENLDSDPNGFIGFSFNEKGEYTYTYINEDGEIDCHLAQGDYQVRAEDELVITNHSGPATSDSSVGVAEIEIEEGFDSYLEITPTQPQKQSTKRFKKINRSITQDDLDDAPFCDVSHFNDVDQGMSVSVANIK